MEKLTEITFLGCGTSTGVPVISCECSICTSENPKNKRTRSSLYIQTESTSLLIDAGPDLREQALREKITRADAVLFTHGHADHTAGFDDVRAFCWRREERLPIYGSRDTLNILESMFPWAFDKQYPGLGYVKADAQEIKKEFKIGDITVIPFEVEHASIQTHGFILQLPSGKSLAYACDMKALPKESNSLLSRCDIHIFDGLRFQEHPSHMTVQEACNLADSLASPETYLTHLSHDIDYAMECELPKNRHYAYDGLTLTL